MQINGAWLESDDGVVRPFVTVFVREDDGRAHSEDFLIDSGADRTVFSMGLLTRLRLPMSQTEPGTALTGISGATPFVLVTTAIELTADDGRPAFVRGQFAAFADPLASDLSILGRDVLDHFDVIISRRRGEILLLAPNHHYQIVRSP